MNKRLYKALKSRIFMALVAMGVLLFSCGCGKEEAVQPDVNSHVPGEEYGYVSEIHTMKEEEFGEYGMRIPFFTEEKFFYRHDAYPNGPYGMPVSIMECRSLDNVTQIGDAKFEFSVPDCQTSINAMAADAEGNIYAVWSAYSIYVEGEEYDYKLQGVWLVKYDGAGNQLESVSLLEELEEWYVYEMCVDKAGRLYMNSGEKVFVYNSKLKYEKTIDIPGFQNMFLADGERVFGMQHAGMGPELIELDAEKGGVKATYGNIPAFNGFFADGRNGKLLYSSTSKLYEYDLATCESVEVLNWVDTNVNGNYISAFKVLKDGRFALVYDNYEDDPEVIFLTKVPRAQIPEKEVLTLASFTGDGSTLQQHIIQFNRNSEKYKVELKTYYEYGMANGPEDFDDAMTLLHMDIVSGDAPDLIYLNQLDIYNLADSQALEDLTPYLENSQTVKREDFLESVLEAYEIDGRLVTIPTSFTMRSLFAKERLVGAEAGWTLEEMMALKEKYPEPLFIPRLDRILALRMCLEYSWESFVNEETGECFFDSEEFVKVLEFTNSFGQWGGFEQEPYDALQKDEMILVDEVISDIENYQMVRLLIEEPSTAIGYPSSDGTPVTVISGWDTYAIATRSDNKEGAWEFMESVLAEENMQKVYFSFPTRVSLLEEMFAEAMEKEYETDETGNVLYNEAGEPIEKIKYTWGYGEWTAEIYAATEEEINELRQMMSHVRVEGGRSQTIIEIVQEEAGAYFAGQKTAEEVAEIIQSRVEIYVSENR